MTVSIRPYVLSDQDAINRVAIAAFSQYEPCYEDWGNFRAGIGRMANLADDADLFVAERSGRVVGGVAHVGPHQPRSPIFPESWSLIRMLVVEPQERGHGIGSRLVIACLERALQAGAPMIGLHTSPIMQSALAMYTGIGFQRDCELPPIKGVPYSRYVLEHAAIPEALARLKTR